MKSLDLRYCVKCQAIAKGAEFVCQHLLYRRCDSFSDCESDKDMYHSVFRRSDHYWGAEHVLEHIAYTLCSYPSESVVGRMGSALEKICEVHSGSKTSTNDRNISMTKMSQQK